MVATLCRGRFIAEMSFLTGDPASADVIAHGRVTYISWNSEKLKHLRTLNPSLMFNIQSVLEKDLSAKIKAASRRRTGNEK